MSALDTLFNITNNQYLFNYHFRYCLVDDSKHPFTIKETMARPNHAEDFVELSELLNLSVETLEKYKGLGISIQASRVCAIDIDHCVERPFDVNSISLLAQQIIEHFEINNCGYIEFSFSGCGIRIFFEANPIKDYELKYYTKNSKLNIEYYYPEGSNRYVTITGRTIVSNNISIQKYKYDTDDVLYRFLETYMKRRYVLAKQHNNIVDDRSIDELMKIVKLKYLNDYSFQELWFSQAPGSGHDESERDYHLVAYIYDYVTKDKDKIKQIFEHSPFFKSKDWKHVNKWTKQDFRYFSYLYDRINSKGE